MLEVDETFMMIWLSRSSEVKVRRWPQSPFGTIFGIMVFFSRVQCLHKIKILLSGDFPKFWTWNVDLRRVLLTVDRRLSPVDYYSIVKSAIYGYLAVYRTTVPLRRCSSPTPTNGNTSCCTWNCSMATAVTSACLRARGSRSSRSRPRRSSLWKMPTVCSQSLVVRWLLVV